MLATYRTHFTCLSIGRWGLYFSFWQCVLLLIREGYEDMWNDCLAGGLVLMTLSNAPHRKAYLPAWVNRFTRGFSFFLAFEGVAFILETVMGWEEDEAQGVMDMVDMDPDDEDEIIQEEIEDELMDDRNQVNFIYEL